MARYEIGDIVKPRFFNQTSGLQEYYIITDVGDFTVNESKQDVVYELMKIYPVNKDIKVEQRDEKLLEIVGSGKEKSGQSILDYVKSQRERRGFNGPLPYEVEIERTLRSKRPKDLRYEDVIYYHKIKTVDECLDALNDLDGFYRAFGDEAYLQLKEVIHKRIIELTK